MMQLKISIPSKIILDTSIEKIVAEDSLGSFCILPKHIDCIRILVPCIITYLSSNTEKYIAVDEGCLIKCKEEIQISTKNSITS